MNMVFTSYVYEILLLYYVVRLTITLQLYLHGGQWWPLFLKYCLYSVQTKLYSYLYIVYIL